MATVCLLQKLRGTSLLGYPVGDATQLLTFGVFPGHETPADKRIYKRLYQRQTTLLTMHTWQVRTAGEGTLPGFDHAVADRAFM